MISSAFTGENRHELQQSAKQLPYSLTETFRFADSNAVKVYPFDLENDGADELLVLFKETKIRYSLQLSRNVIQQVLGQRNYTKEEVTDIGLFFRTPQGEPRFCMTTKEKDTAFLEILDDTLGLVTKIPIITGMDNNGSGSWDGDARLITAKDLNGDSYPDVIIKIQSAYDAFPRGISAIDLKHRRKLWEFLTGSTVTDVVIQDLDKDGHQEILFGGGAPNNGAKVNDTDDKHSYLIILNHKGERLWQQETGGIFSSCVPAIADLKSDGQLKIVSMFQSRGPEQLEVGRITIRDAKSRSIEKDYPVIIEPKKLVIADLDFNGHQEIIIAAQGVPPKIYVLSDSLTLMTSISLPFAAKSLIVEDLNDDGKQEIIVSNKEAGETMVLNTKLEKLAASKIGGNLHILHQGLGRPKLLIVLSSQGIVLSELQKAPLVYQYSIKSLILGFISGTLLCALFLFLLKSFKPKFLYSKEAMLLINNISIGILWLNKKGKVKFYSRAATTLLDIEVNNSVGDLGIHFLQSTHLSLIKNMTSNIKLAGNNPNYNNYQQKIVIGSKEIVVQIFQIGKKISNTGYLVILEDITDRLHSQKVLVWAALAQKLAHEIKNPLYTILLTLQRFQLAYQEDQVTNVKTYDIYANSIIEEIERLRRVTDGFMKFTNLKPPEYVILPTEALVKKVEDRAREWLPKEVTLKVEAEKQLLELRVDVDQMQRLFFNLFDNAIKAMDGKGRLCFRTSLAQWIDSSKASKITEIVVFEVSDTGCGIPEDKLIEVFEPYVTLRKVGTGLGLTICKKIVEDHGGRISIQSKIGVGTIVKVEIPVTMTKEEETSINGNS